jgi:hypothetical protein
MIEKLSIVDDGQINLRTISSDVKAALLKGVVGAAPMLGPLISEALSIIIPNQKINRVIAFVEVLEIKLKHLEEDLLTQKLFTEEFTDLLEDALNQATRAMSDDRREYIASLLKNGISRDDLDHIDKKKMLSILGELNDAEVLVLTYHSLRTMSRRGEFAELHPELFGRAAPTLGSPKVEIDKATLRSSYRQKLGQFGLLRPSFKTVRKGELPEFDEKTGTIKASGYEATPLGQLFLQYIDIASHSKPKLIAQRRSQRRREM